MSSRGVSDIRRRIRKSLPRRYRRVFDVLSDVRNWYVAAFVVLAAGLINYILTGSRVSPLAFVPPHRMAATPSLTFHNLK